MRFSVYVLLRRIISSFVIVFITIGTFGIGGAAFTFLSRLEFGQIFIDLSARTVIVCFFIILVSAVFGRVYCSTLCPLGIFQDMAGALRRSLIGKKYSFHEQSKIFRHLTFAFVVALFILGVPSLIGIFDPYSIYIRGASRLLDKSIGLVMDFIDPLLRTVGTYSSYSPGSFHIVPVAIFVFVFVAALFRGRLFCNTICPVGVILGCASRAPLIRPAFIDSCISCGKCEAVCKAECISVADKLIDSSRCVMCGNCIAACPVAAMNFSSINLKYDHEKRSTMKSIASIALFTALPIIKHSNLLTSIPALSAFSNKIKESGLHPQIPAGAMSWARLRDKCIACHACIKRCPSKVLEPAGAKYGINGILKPVLNLNNGFCQYDCVVCGHTCPFDAIMPIDINEKHKIQTGIANYTRERCVITTNKERCGACAEHCPTGALEMLQSENDSELKPTIKSKLCVGCGACEYICPVIPEKAIQVKPHTIHQAAEVLQMQDNNILNSKDDDFVF